jgi:hypothetical protein
LQKRTLKVRQVEQVVLDQLATPDTLAILALPGVVELVRVLLERLDIPEHRELLVQLVTRVTPEGLATRVIPGAKVLLEL